MSSLPQLVLEARKNQRLIFVPYLVPGAPTDDLYRGAINTMKGLGVSIFETTCPVRSNWSPHTGDVIAGALQASTWDLIRVSDHLRSFEESIFVLYEEMLLEASLSDVLDKLQNRVDFLIPEWQIEDHHLIEEACLCRDINYVYSLSPTDDDQTVQNRLEKVPDQSLIYILSGTQTGGKLFEKERLHSFLRKIKQYRPNIFLFAGFGIQTPEDLKILAKINELDGVFVGSALIGALYRSMAHFTRLSSEFINACQRR